MVGRFGEYFATRIVQTNSHVTNSRWSAESTRVAEAAREPGMELRGLVQSAIAWGNLSCAMTRAARCVISSRFI